MQIQNLKFFTYDQNNSGGSFSFDAKRGISTKVIVQARDAREADYRAERIGLYFDGTGDCGCCGDRWYSQAYGGEGFDSPMIYRGMHIAEWITDEHFTKWMGPDLPELYVHLYDDRFQGFVYGGADGYPIRLFEFEEDPVRYRIDRKILEIGS